jgi:DnaJ-class molecular chaperone
MESDNFYEVLGVSETSSPEEITARFRKLSKLFHPDKNPESSVDYASIILAYKTLKNASSRASHDRALANERHRRAVLEENLAARAKFLSPERVEYRHSLSNMMRSGVERSEAEEDILVRVHPLEVKLGVTAPIEVPARSVCPKCGGGDLGCYRCEGAGFVKTVEKLPFRIPSYTKDGDTFDFDAQETPNVPAGLQFRPRHLRIRIRFL